MAAVWHWAVWMGLKWGERERERERGGGGSARVCSPLDLSVFCDLDPMVAASERDDQIGNVSVQLEPLHQHLPHNCAWTGVVGHHCEVGQLVYILHLVQEPQSSQHALLHVVDAEVLCTKHTHTHLHNATFHTNLTLSPQSVLNSHQPLSKLNRN